MAYLVLAAWLIQSAVGVIMFARWWRGGRHGAPTLLAHVVPVLVALALWVVFIATGALTAAWCAFAILTVALSFGDVMLVRRSQHMSGAAKGGPASYGRAIVRVFRGELPRRVVFHALFSPVVYFSALAVCIGATVS